MSASHQSARRDSSGSASVRPTRSRNDEETVLDPSRASFSFRGRRDEEGILYDPPPSTPERRRSAAASHAEPEGGVAVASKPSKDPKKEVQGFSREEMGRIKQADKALEVVYGAQTSLRSGLPRLYAELATFNPFPTPGLFSRMMQWVGSGFGLMTTSAAEEDAQRESIQERISSKISKVKEIHSRGISEAETKMRDEFKGRRFLVNRETPRLLKQVSIPEGKKHVPYEKLQETLKREVGGGGTRIKISCPSNERTIIYRKRPDNSWESLELSWRQPGKVDIIRNGIKEAHLFNEDALQAAKLFVEGRKVSFKEKKIDPKTVWKVI